MDYSLTNAFQYNMQGISRVLSFYDINCSYMTKLPHRVQKNNFLHFPAHIEIVPGIGI